MGAVPTSPTPARGPGIIVSRGAAAVCTPAHWPSWVLGPWKLPKLSFGPVHQCSAATRPQQLLSGLGVAVPGAPGHLWSWGIQGLSPDELCVQPALLQELFMGPHLERGRRGR